MDAVRRNRKLLRGVNRKAFVPGPEIQRNAHPDIVLAHYKKFFGSLAMASLALGLFSLLLMPIIHRWMHGVR